MSLTEILIFVYLGLTAILHIVVPISGSAVVTPVLALLTEPHTAIGLASAYFVLSGIVRITVFRKGVIFEEIKKLLPLSVLSAAIGALLLVYISEQLLIGLILLSTIYFLLVRLEIIQKTKESKLVSGGV